MPRRPHATRKRDLEMVALYKAGKTLVEVGEQFGLSAMGVKYAIAKLTPLRAKGRRPAVRPAVEIPKWVPAALADHYQEVALAKGEERAASIVRKLKHEASHHA